MVVVDPYILLSSKLMRDEHDSESASGLILGQCTWKQSGTIEAYFFNDHWWLWHHLFRIKAQEYTGRSKLLLQLGTSYTVIFHISYSVDVPTRSPPKMAAAYPHQIYSMIDSSSCFDVIGTGSIKNEVLHNIQND